jgi:hypothetical protein
MNMMTGIIIIILLQLIDVAIPEDRNFVQKEAEKMLKYNSLGTDMQRNVEPEMCDYTSYNWSHRNSNE